MKAAFYSLWYLAVCLSARANSIAPPPQYSEAVDNGTYGYYPIRTYVTAEGIESPQTNYLQWTPQCDDGLYNFITPRGWGLPTPGPMILDNWGELVWAKHFDNSYGGQAYDFKVQEFESDTYLTFWLGDDRVRGHGSGFYYMLNASYDIVHKVGAANGLSADLHEFLITPEGNALMTMYQVTPHDVTAFRDFDIEEAEDQDPNYIWDCVFQEVSVATGELVYEWRASEHISINETYHEIGPGGTKNDPFDWFHINSVAKDELGNYLISARYTHSLSYIDGRTGEVLWRLGGRRNSFTDLSGGYGLNFAWQHDARFLPLDTFPNMYSPPTPRPGFTTKLVSFFDNAAEDQHYEYGLTYSRGMLLEITYPTPGSGYEAPKHAKRREEYNEPETNNAKIAAVNGTNTDYTVRVIKSYENPKLVRSSSQGSMQVIPQQGRDPKVIVGFGLNAVWTEFEADGTIICDVHYGAETSWERGDIQSYRTYKMPWVAEPRTNPSVDISDDDVEVYVSWNGATEVMDWILQCAESETDDEQAWADVVRVSKQGFETIIPVPDEVGDSRYLRIIAIADTGRRLPCGTSELIDRGIMNAYFKTPIVQAVPTEVSQFTRRNVLLIAAATISLLFVAYQASRRYVMWRKSPGTGPVMWRRPQGPAYRILAKRIRFDDAALEDADKADLIHKIRGLQNELEALYREHAASAVSNAAAIQSAGTLSAAQVDEKAKSARRVMIKGIKKQMTWKPSCKTSSAKFSYSTALHSKQVFDALTNQAADAKKLKKQLSFTPGEFEEDIAQDSIEASVRYCNLRLTGKSVTMKWIEEEQMISLGGSHGV